MQHKIERFKIRTLFFGSGSFALVILKALLKADFLDVIGVITQPDKPFGRKRKIKHTLVKGYLNSLRFSGKIFQPENITAAAAEILKKINPELIIVADYGQILPASIIRYPKYKCLNIHGSLLPDLRGAVPIPVAILKGYQETGISIPVMTEELDNGPLVASKKIAIMTDDTAVTLKSRLADLGASLLLEILQDWISGKIKPVAQDESKASYADKNDFSKENAKITPDTRADIAERMVRAYNPWPVAWTKVEFNGKIQRLKIFQAELSKVTIPGPGKIYKKNNGLYLSLKNGSLKLIDLQLEGKNRGRSDDYWFLAN